MAWWFLESVIKTFRSENPNQTSQGTCPVDHDTRERYLEESKCPVDHNAQKTYLDMAKSQASFPKRGLSVLYRMSEKYHLYRGIT